MVQLGVRNDRFRLYTTRATISNLTGSFKNSCNLDLSPWYGFRGDLNIYGGKQSRMSGPTLLAVASSEMSTTYAQQPYLFE